MSERGQDGLWMGLFYSNLSARNAPVLVNAKPVELDEYAFLADGYMDVALTRDGQLVTAWTLQRERFPPYDYGDVIARRFRSLTDADAKEEFVATATNADIQSSPAIAAGRRGAWLLGWSHTDYDSLLSSVRFQQFVNGKASGPERTVSTPDAVNANFAGAVASEAGYSFLFWWVAGEASTAGMFGCRITADPLVPVRLSSAVAMPTAAALPGGNILLIWYERPEDEVVGLYSMVVDAELQTVASRSLVWSDPAPDQLRRTNARIAVSPSGDTAVAVWAVGDLRQNERDRDVVGQLMDSQGHPVGDAFRLTVAHATIDQIEPAVAYVSGNEFVATWSSNPTPSFGDEINVVGRRFEVGSLEPLCGDSDDNGFVLSTDALLTLRSAVGSATCDPCLCDTDGSGNVTAFDALATLKAGVALRTLDQCPTCTR